MPELPSPEAFGDYDAWRGRAVTDRGGAPVGSVDELYLDTDTRRPEWVLVRLQGDEDARRFVPLADAHVEGETLRVAHDRDRITSARAASPGPIPQGEERALYAHYSVPVTEAESETVLPAETPAPAQEPVTEVAPAAAPDPEPVAPAGPAAVAAQPVAEPEPVAAAPDPDEPVPPSTSVQDAQLAPAEETASSSPPSSPPFPGPDASSSGGPDPKILGGAAGITLFLLFLLIRRRRR